MSETSKGAKAARYLKTFCYERGSRFVGYLKREAEKRKANKQQEPAADRAARRTMWATVWIAAFTCVLAVVGYLQWTELDESGIQTDRMIRLYRAQVNQLSRQAGDTHDLAGQTKDLAGHMKEQADRTKELAEQAKTQATETTIAADAAKSAAETAKEALHVSERAYLAVSGSQFDFASGNVTISIANTGHLAAGGIEITAFEGNAFNPNPGIAGQSPLIERHWNSSHLGTIAYGLPHTYYISTPGVNEDGVNSGHQVVEFGGIITYSDGFADSPQRRERFCFKGVYDAKAKVQKLAFCDPVDDLDQLIRAVDYPNNKETLPGQPN